MIIAVDVDQTLVDTLTPWLEWFRKVTGVTLTAKDMVINNLTPVMKAKALEAGYKNFDPMAFWRISHLYDDLEPIDGEGGRLINDKLEMLSNGLGNHQIVIVSHCMPEHEHSKRRFLDKFIDYDAFVSTSDKWFVNYDVIFDDNCSIITNGIHKRPRSAHVHFTQVVDEWSHPKNDGRFVADSWDCIAPNFHLMNPYILHDEYLPKWKQKYSK